MSYFFTSGSSEYLITSSAVVTVAPFTMACWFNTNELTTFLTMMALADSSVETQRIFMLVRGTTGGDPISMHFEDSGGNTTTNTSTGITANTWHHGCIVAAASNDRTIYLDGGSSASSTVSRSPTGIDNTSIGMVRDSTPSSPFDGLIAETAIWDTSLTSDEVIILAARYSPLFVRPQNLIFYAPIIRDLFDRTGGLTLSLGGSPSVDNHPPIIYPSALLMPQPTIAAAGVLSPYYYHNLLSV